MNIPDVPFWVSVVKRSHFKDHQELTLGLSASYLRASDERQRVKGWGYYCVSQMRSLFDALFVAQHSKMVLRLNFIPTL